MTDTIVMDRKSESFYNHVEKSTLQWRRNQNQQVKYVKVTTEKKEERRKKKKKRFKQRICGRFRVWISVAQEEITVATARGR
jgi:RNase H-fold protein (predicted Holliday junction resolvase)